MELSFYKYQGTGNDFVMVDDREEHFDSENLDLVRHLCHRRFGIGSDGLILVRNSGTCDFEMIYHNADGSQSMCGNGARCAVAFAAFLGIVSKNARFLAIDGIHQARINNGMVELEMRPVDKISKMGNDYFVNTGSPHHIRFVENISNFPVLVTGAQIRYSELYHPLGANVNFISPVSEEEIEVRTYERGVEDETLSCGTGVTACALVYGQRNGLNEVKIKTRGGELKVKFKVNSEGRYQQIWLIGPAEQVFSGNIQVDQQKRLMGEDNAQ